MTDYTDMQPEEIDELVAKRVMGWVVIRVGYWGTKDESPEQRKHAKWIDRVKPNGNSVGLFYCDLSGDRWELAEDWYAKKPWSPSTSIADAWEVVERMRELAREEMHAGQEHAGIYSDVWFRFIKGLRGGRFCEAAVLWHIDPAAICIAALRARDE